MNTPRLDFRQRIQSFEIGMAVVFVAIVLVFEGVPFLIEELIGADHASDSSGFLIFTVILFGAAGCYAGYLAVEEMSKWHFHFECHHCGKAIGSDMAWTCGYCGTRTEKPRGAVIDSFLAHCSQCNFVPKSVLCQHCHGLILLDNTANSSHPAYHEPPPPAESAAARMQREAEELRLEQERVEQEIELTGRQERLAVAKARLQKLRQPPEDTILSPLEKLLASISDRHNRVNALIQFERDKRQDIEQRTDLNDEEKTVLLEELSTMVEQARMMGE
jgi:phage terminase large subunit GpA-like protein